MAEKRSLEDFQKGQRRKTAAAPLRMVDGGAGDVSQENAALNGAAPAPAENIEGADPEVSDALEEQLDPMAEACRRCGHMPCQHIEGPCQVLGCECSTFVYPPDIEDGRQARLPGEGFERTDAEKQLYPLIRNLDRVRGVRLQANKDEKDAQDACLKVMKQHHLGSIVVDGKRWILVAGKEKVKTSDKEEGEGEEPSLDLDD